MDFGILAERLNVKFRDRSLLKQALTHRSYLNENKAYPLGNNQRLEFLGDSLIEYVVTDFLYRNYVDADEGKLTEYRSAIVCNKVLSELSSSLGLNDFLLLSKGEARDTGRSRESILADTFEAVIGAIYLDQGLEFAVQFVRRTLLERVGELIDTVSLRDPKGSLQKYSQEKFRVTPEYKLHSESGPDHDKVFEVGVYFGAKLVAIGSGSSKALAEKGSATNALAKLMK